MHDTGDSRRFALFCIARVGAQIYDTGLIHPIDRNSTDVTFNDVLLFSKMPPYFELKLELYSFLLSDQSMVGGTARFVQGAKSLSKAVGKRIAKTLRDHTNQENDDNVAREQRLAGPKFDLLATATLRLEEAGEQVRSHEFYMEENATSLISFLPCLVTFAAGWLSSLTAGRSQFSREVWRSGKSVALGKRNVGFS